MSSNPVVPDRVVERRLRDEGHDVVVGIDEVGKGAWAGPLAVGIARVPFDDLEGVPIRDSKTLSEKARERMFDAVRDWCTEWAVGLASHEECDGLGMAEAQRLATRRALEQLETHPTAAVVDGSWDFVSPSVRRVQMMVKADAACLSVAAASIIAKVTRDRMMRELAASYPAWRFDTNKGYPCQWHRAALSAYGPSAVHRRSWAFMDNFVPWPGTPRLERSPSLF